MPEVVVVSEFIVDPESGIIAPAHIKLSPNQDARPVDTVVNLIVLHGISLPPGEYGGDSIDGLFLNTLDWDAHPYFEEIRGLKVSAHLLLRRDGSLTQFVPFAARAWHAGESCFRGQRCCNDYSIGIELEGEDDVPYDERQYTVLPAVVAAIMDAYPAISSADIVGHSDVAPGRKTDPGPAFDWQRLYDALNTSAG